MSNVLKAFPLHAQIKDPWWAASISGRAMPVRWRLSTSVLCNGRMLLLLVKRGSKACLLLHRLWVRLTSPHPQSCPETRRLTLWTPTYTQATSSSMGRPRQLHFSAMLKLYRTIKPRVFRVDPLNDRWHHFCTTTISSATHRITCLWHHVRLT